MTGAPLEYLTSAVKLVDPELRSAAATELARSLGGDTLIIFLRDAVTGVMLPAPGFPHTIPNGRAWHAFLDEVISRGGYSGSLMFGANTALRPVVGVSCDESSALLLIGSDRHADDLAWVRAVLPALVAALRGQHIAEDARRAKAEFLATMSHELRTPLNAIAGHVQLLEIGIYGKLNEQQLSALARVDRSQRHLLGLINDVLNLSRIESGRVDYHLSAVPLSAALADIKPLIEPQFAARGLRCDLDAGDETLCVEADREKLQQVLLNLLSNAVKFTARGGKVTVVCHLVDDRRAAIDVVDTGRGVPASKLDVIFDPFVQVDSSHSRESPGTGLGLSISRDLARGMGGDLFVESTLGVGSTFRLVLPLAH